jgi:hypothetical protein
VDRRVDEGLSFAHTTLDEFPYVGVTRAVCNIRELEKVEIQEEFW